MEGGGSPEQVASNQLFVRRKLLDKVSEMKHGRSGAARRLRIAQVATLYERIPPVLYGGTERVVSYLTEELVRRRHDVTLFAAGDSRTTANLAPGCPEALRLLGRPELGGPLQLAMLSNVYEKAAERFDI